MKDDETDAAARAAESLARLNPYALNQLPVSLEAIINQTSMARLSERVPLAGCRLEVIARWNSHVAEVDAEIWSHFSNAERAATYLNLALVASSKTHDTSEDLRQRKIIAHLFARTPFESVLPMGAVPDLICMDTESTPSKFNTAFAVLIRQSTAILHFLTFDGLPVISRKSVEFDASIFDLSDPQGQMVWGTTESRFENKEAVTLIRGANLQLQVRKTFGNPNAGGDYNITCASNKKGAQASAF